MTSKKFENAEIHGVNQASFFFRSNTCKESGEPMILVDWMQNLLVSTAVDTHQRKQDRDLEIMEERIKAGLE